MANLWTVYYLTDSGREIPHYSVRTRKDARMVADALRRVQPGLKVRVRRD